MATGVRNIIFFSGALLSCSLASKYLPLVFTAATVMKLSGSQNKLANKRYENRRETCWKEEGVQQRGEGAKRR